MKWFSTLGGSRLRVFNDNNCFALAVSGEWHFRGDLKHPIIMIIPPEPHL
jgi:hypothetical protein